MISIHALREEGDRWREKLPSGRPDFYPRPPRGGRRASVTSGKHGASISIHALREEGDQRTPLQHFRPYLFLSTPSARRATTAVSFPASCRDNFYPRPPRGGRPRVVALSAFAANFYPRPPRGGRPGELFTDIARDLFLSTPSARRAT